MLFQKLKDEIAIDMPGIRVLCPTRWTAIQSVLDNFEVLLGVWENLKLQILTAKHGLELLE